MDSTKDFIKAWVDIGRQQAFSVIAAKCSVAQAITMKRIKESRVYEELGFTWDEYCPERFGIARGTADKIINQLTEFGQAYFRLGQLARITEAEFRQIASDVSEIRHPPARSLHGRRYSTHRISTAFGIRSRDQPGDPR